MHHEKAALIMYSDSRSHEIDKAGGSFRWSPDRKYQPTTGNGCMNTINDTNETTTSPGKRKTLFQRIGIDEACPGS